MFHTFWGSRTTGELFLGKRPGPPVAQLRHAVPEHCYRGDPGGEEDYGWSVFIEETRPGSTAPAACGAGSLLRE